HCDRSYRPWSSLEPDGRISIRNEFSDAKCRARALLLKDDYTNAPGEWHGVEERFVFENDIVEVECKRSGQVAYKFLHSQIWTGENRLSFIGLMDTHAKSENASVDVKQKFPSVYIMLMDSFGASHAKRVFPNTIQFLKDTFQSVEMHHLNKVGENSRPNAFPFLFGKPERLSKESTETSGASRISMIYQKDMAGQPSPRPRGGSLLFGGLEASVAELGRCVDELEETLAGLARKLLGVPSGSHTLESLSAGNTDGVDHLVLGEDLVDEDLQTLLSPLDLVGDGPSVELDLHNVGLLVAVLEKLLLKFE
ncbi:hypothetical protein PRIPAC_92885, partial [Pristionchus pacificus]|uniref:Uncharacterized protein n=2 Tax=Pristionchus pacificus TaxID=54126 RepID=A0A2A6BBS3_PRIPA